MLCSADLFNRPNDRSIRDWMRLEWASLFDTASLTLNRLALT